MNECFFTPKVLTSGHYPSDNGHSGCTFSNFILLATPASLPFLPSHLAPGRQHSGPDDRRILASLVMTACVRLNPPGTPTPTPVTLTEALCLSEALLTASCLYHLITHLRTGKLRSCCWRASEYQNEGQGWTWGFLDCPVQLWT